MAGCTCIHSNEKRAYILRGTVKDILHKTGLSEKEIEVYILISKMGALNQTEVIKHLNLNRGQTYRLIKNLQKKGAVETTLEQPVRFVAVPFDNIVDNYIKTQRQEVEKIEESRNELLSDWERINHTELEPALERFSVLEGKKKIFNKISEMLKETVHEFSCALCISDLCESEQYEVFTSISNQLLSSNSKYQVLTELSKEKFNALKLIKKTINPKFSFRAINTELGLSKFPRIVIKDNSEIIIFISDNAKENEACLLTNCKSIIQSFSGIFQGYWRDSIDINEILSENKETTPSYRTQIIKSSMVAKRTYVKELNSAVNKIFFITSEKGLIHLEKNDLILRNMFEKNVDIKIMAPITSINLEPAQRLLDYCEVRHIPIGYLETTIIDDKQLFQFNSLFGHTTNFLEESGYENTLYTNDPTYVDKIKKMLNELWKKTHTPLGTPLKHNSHFSVSKNVTHSSLRKCDRYGQKNVEFLRKNQINEKYVLDKFERIKKSKKGCSNNTWSDKLSFLGSRAFALIYPTDFLNLPEMIIGIFQNNSSSAFGKENMLKVFLRAEKENANSFQLVAHVQDNSKSFQFQRQLLKGMPAEKNMILVKENQLNVKVQKNTLFAGWTVHIPLINTDYVLPPSCILFEGFGEVQSGIFEFTWPSGRKDKCWYNDLESFVTFFHPKSKYVGSGTEGFFDRESIQVSFPPE